ncbi:MAG TPA: hypothetical protein VHE13_06930 [Opitutus sp.]|nr:hypothetical protein [Opitutus sp.]
MTADSQNFDRFAQVGDLAASVRRLLSRLWMPLVILSVGDVGLLAYSRNAGTIAFAFIALGTLVIFGVWRRQGIGLPLLPLVGAQHLLVYGLPIVTYHSVVHEYPQQFVTDAGAEVLAFSCAATVGWLIAMRTFRPSLPISYALPDFQHQGSEKLKRLGLGLIAVATAYQVAEKANLLGFLFSLLPAGSVSLLVPVVTGASACGFFLMALFVGSHQINHTQRILFWGLLVVSTTVSASGFLLSAATTMIAAVLIGLFWGTGRIPWRYLIIVFLILSFFSVGKFTMRGRYWDFDGQMVEHANDFSRMPVVYAEWTVASFEALTTPVPDEAQITKQASTENRQTLLDRINNLQNLLFVIDAIKVDHIAPLEGATYKVIPPLLVPRILWPDKPRSHEGQVMLNVHFGRQDINSTYKTYVAWGLIPEAYGNFGAFAGSIIIGVAMGVVFAGLENLSARKLLLSLEGFVCFAILLGFAGAFEMVASVLITTLFQQIVPIIVACLPFLRRMRITGSEIVTT